MNSQDLQDWLDRYVAAWRANQRAPIEALFTQDVVYRFRPYDGHPAAHGIDEVVEAWLGDARDEPDGWEAAYQAFAVDGDRAVATGYSRYVATADAPERMYHNAFLLHFAADGRCSEFIEYYMLESDE